MQYNLHFPYFFYDYLNNLSTFLLMNFLKNYLSTISFLYFAYFFYSTNHHMINFTSGSVWFVFNDFSFQIIEVFHFVFIAYFILLIPYYLIYKTPSKARLVYMYLWEIIKWGNNYNDKNKTALLAWIVKLFFVPLMLVWITQHCFNLVNNSYTSYLNIELLGSDFLTYFNTHFFMWAFTAILFFDVLFFTLWYLLEAPIFKNTIKSVEPTLLWWAVVLICYPPFNTNLTNLVGWYSNDFPQFSNALIHISLNITILVLMAIYAWASIALWLKASNLTNRWIVRTWPYKYIRHPAYICKNTAWLIWWIPLVYLSLSDPTLSTLTVSIWLISWAFVYYLRAMTEEAHLSLDPDYRAYKKLVPYKFIPKIW